MKGYLAVVVGGRCTVAVLGVVVTVFTCLTFFSELSREVMVSRTGEKFCVGNVDTQL